MRRSQLRRSPGPGPTFGRGLRVLLLLGLLSGGGCGGGDTTTQPGPEPSYAERIAAGWTAFEAGNFDPARSQFLAAVAADPAPLEGWMGLGWTELRRSDPDAAHDAFESGSDKNGSDAQRADLLAGWAFGWSARSTQAGRFSESNARIDEVETLTSTWSFAHAPGLDADDLVLLAAENHFALGAFAASLARVQVLDPAFTADIGTPAGQAALAAKIEALRVGP
ncbi:MAG: hypothetical protein R3B81_01965 [bacterium]